MRALWQSPIRPHRTVLAFTAALALASACGIVHPAPGALVPVHERLTNQVRAADLATLEAWEARRLAMLRNDGANLPAYSAVLARAGAWLAFARDAYVTHPGSHDADEALAEARRLLDSLATGGRGASPARVPGSLAASAERTSPELWARLRELESKPESTNAVRAARLAEAEIELVRAAALRPATPASDPLKSTESPFVVALAGAPAPADADMPASLIELPSNVSAASVSKLACPQLQHVVRAGRLLLAVDSSTAVRDMRITASDDVTTLARAVHFAVSSDRLNPTSATLLVGVAEMMREHPELSLVIEGHADPRGHKMDNIMLSGRRAFTVRDLLASDGIDGERVMVRMYGSARRDATGTTPLDYARDRRVQLKFLLADGTELPITTNLTDLQIERPRLWFGARGPAHRRRVPPPESTPSSALAAAPRLNMSARAQLASRPTKKVKR